jgi:NitT/TauT family transport system ATP-binding protein
MSDDAHARFVGATKVFAPTSSGQKPVHALGPVDLTLRKGEFVAVVGPSGCGKTTLLESLAGLVTLTEGSVLFEEEAVRGEAPEGLGVVFQEDASLPWLTVWENAAFGLRRKGESGARIREEVDRALAFMGLASFASSYPAQLSGGMRQRMCIARTLVMRPRLILLDEPFGALDQQTRLLMGDELLRLWRESSATVMLITHAIDEAVMLADRVAVMSARPGRIIDTVETNWPRERDSRTVTDPRFGSLTARVWETLRAESMKAIGYSDRGPEVAASS